MPHHPKSRLAIMAVGGAVVPAIVASGLAVPAIAADYPSKPVTLVIPYRAGGSTETMGRVFSKALGKELGTRVIVRTRPGAGGAVGATEVAKKKADGYNLLFAAAVSLLWPPLRQKVEFDLDSFTYIGQITNYQQALVARQDAPYNTLKELIAHAKKKRLNYADQGAMTRAFVEYIASKEGVKWTGIPTKGGGEMVPFLLGGKVDFAWSGGIHNRFAGKMKVLLSFNATRLVASPDIPSIGEQYGVAMPSQAVIVGPKGLDAALVTKIEGAIAKAVKDKAFVDLLTTKLKFPAKFVGHKALTADIEKTVAGLNLGRPAGATRPPARGPRRPAPPGRRTAPRRRQNRQPAPARGRNLPRVRC
ncbi:MAG: tripartite tricarboxylate transporter substrate binding protein [Rhodospirillaceae bacterium]|nr:tripartite tricarboxylate transporter substrate binding protein [Rhodospirillaceae bacterium]